MYLKSIELQGFKSFPEKTTLSFNEGITVIIGPNGSGKSNIADAVRWVLGEVSSRSIRGTKMEDIIFGGCDIRKPSTFAQVSLTLDNSSPQSRLNIDYETVTVTRRYFRGGDSDYLINGKAVRLKDIHALFMNTGIGRGGYSVIGQGRIAEIVSQKSDERRAVFEEAAGISKYKFSKNEAARKLSATEENLSRAGDILAELEGRIGPLEREAEKARRYLLLYDEKKRLDISLWLHEVSSLSESITRLSGTYELYKTELEYAEGELAALEEKTGALDDALQGAKYERELAGTQLAELTERKFAQSSKISVALNEIEHLKSAASDAEAEAKRLDTAIHAILAEADESASLCAQCEERLSSSNAQLRECESSYNDITAQLERMSAEADLCAERIKHASDELIDLKIKLTVTDTATSADEEKNEALDAEAAQREENLALVTARCERAEETMISYEQKRNDADAAALKLRAQAEEKDREVQSLREKANDIYIDISSKKHRADNLRRMEELLEGYSHSVRFIMDEYKKGNIRSKSGGVCGKIYAPLSLLISVEGAYTTAVETALGAAMQNIAVEDEEAAKDAIRHLQKTKAGRATFYPISTIKPQYLSYPAKELAENDGFVGIASDLITCEDKFRNITSNLLGRTVVFESMDKATVFAKKYDYKIRIVTLDGQQINAGGSFTGGSARSDSGMLKRGAEIDALNEQIASQQKRLEQLNAEISDIAQQSAALCARAQEQENSSALLASLYNAENTQYFVLLSQAEEDKRRIAQLQAEKNDIDAKKQRLAREREEDEGHRAQLESEIASLRAEAAAIEERISEGNLRQEELRVRTGALRVKSAELTKDAEAQHDAAARLRARCEEARGQRDATEERIKELRRRLSENTAAADESDAAVGVISGEIAAVQKRLAELNLQILQTEKALSDARGTEREKLHKKELLFREYTQAQSRLASAGAEREKLTQSLSDDYELSYSEAKEAAASQGYPVVTAQSKGELTQRQTELRNKLRALGHVNVGAADEYKEVRERYDFLKGQTDDLLKSKSELEEIIFKLDEEMKLCFSETVAQVNVCFGKVFRKLFGGGVAELRVSDPDNLLESGIEINVAPPGKIIKSMSLLSGGEQSFVAIALYFALIEVNPTPFILLDEIEAALDEVNVDRFADYLSEYKENTQFILISHRRGTMEAADRLYGVTMPVKGISRILAVDIGEIEQKIGKLE